MINTKKHFICFIIFIYILVFFFANARANSADSSSKGIIHSLFVKGKAKGQLRMSFRATDNTKELPDYYALAAGGRLGYNSGDWKGFSFGVMGYADFILARNFEKPDANNRQSRYELSLGDITDPTKKEIVMLGEAWLRYAYKFASIKFGRMRLESPLINSQDSRMIPTLLQGLWCEANPKRFNFGLGFISHISPRSTSHFYSVGQSLGANSQGLDVNGKPQAYRNNTATKGIFLGRAKYTLTTKNKWSYYLDIWEYFTENIFNSLFIETQVKKSVGTLEWNITGQFLQQNVVNNGGNETVSKAYFPHEGLSHYIAARLEAVITSNNFSFSYGRITKEGRFLNPREWGVERLLTRYTAERTDGCSNTHEMLFVWSKDLGEFVKGLQARLAYSLYIVPDPSNFRDNKYGLPSYHQPVLDLIYTPAGLLKGLNLRAFITRKFDIGNSSNNLNYYFNKTNMTHVTVILSYDF